MSGNLLFIIIIFIVAVIIAVWYFYRMKVRYRASSDDFVKGLLSIIENDLPSAMKYLHSAATNDTSNIMAYTLLGDILRQNGEIEKAKRIHISLLSRAFITSEQKARVYKSLALDAFAENNFQKSLEYANQILSLKPDMWTYEFAAEILEKLERWNEAYEMLSKTGDNKEILALYKVEIGKNIVEDNPHKARVIFKDALKIYPDCLPAMMEIGYAYANEGRLKDALEWWTKIATKFPQKSIVVMDKIESVYYELGEFDKARLLYRDILEKNPEVEFIRLRLAEIYEKMGNIETALKIVREAPEKTMNLLLSEIKFLCETNEMQSIKKIVSKKIEELHKPKFICRNCGYQSDVPLWHCPKCGEWNSFDV